MEKENNKFENKDQEMVEININSQFKVGESSVFTGGTQTSSKINWWKIPVTRIHNRKTLNKHQQTQSAKLLAFDNQNISVWKLYYSLATRHEIFIMVIAGLGSLGAGISMPMFAILFTFRTISGFGPTNTLAEVSTTLSLMSEIF